MFLELRENISLAEAGLRVDSYDYKQQAKWVIYTISQADGELVEQTGYWHITKDFDL